MTEKDKRLDQQQQSTFARYYDTLIADLAGNEQQIWSELDKLQNQTDMNQGGLNEAVGAAEDIRKWTDHMIGIPKIQEKFETSIEKGLTEAQAAELLQKNGPNCLTERGKVAWYIVFLKEQTGFFSLLLWLGSFLCFLAFIIAEDKSDPSNLYLGIVLAVVVFVTGCFSYMQTSKAASLMDDFKNFIPPEANCLRDGKYERRPAKELVPGDIVELKGGDNVPADVCLFQATEMKVNNASLTGESEDLLRIVDGEQPENIFEATNIAFFGTTCTAGKGRGVVIRTGDDTVIGRIANLSQTADSAETPLSIEIERFIFIISAVAIVLGVSFFIFGFFAGFTLINNVVFMIGIIVANVPEGLLATVTVSLALTAKRMHKKMVLVKNLESVETLGSTSCICSDKTGTLTQNRMSVSNMYFNRKRISADTNWEVYKKEVAKQAAKPENERAKVEVPGYELDDEAFMTFVRSIALTTTSYFAYTPKDEEINAKYLKQTKNDLPKDKAQWTPAMKDAAAAIKKEMVDKEMSMNFMKRNVEGDASETGLVRFIQPILMKKYGGAYENGLDEIRQAYPTFELEDGSLAEIPFSSDIKFNLLVRDMNQANRAPETAADNITVFIKGAPERVLTRCSKILVQGEDVEMTDSIRRECDDSNALFGKMGERVLAFARCQLDPAVYTKDPKYPFDVKGWKGWREQKEFTNAVNGWFPMWDFTLVGLVSLNDPPRPKVDVSVMKCRKAGIKVIMVTGDQPPTAAAIAHKVNIIQNPELEFNYLREKNPEWSYDEALEKAKAIVIHGDTLAAVHAAEEALDDDEIEKGRRIMEWISKDEVVFARTTPSQKLLIVNACQQLGHVVAVTGDGVNDSPAIKKADIGIAMGSGSEVAQNAADMLLLDDNFSSIVNGVEEGRLIFDNLKKSIAYTLSSNIPEISPFLFFMMFAIPQPLSTVLILCIDLGTDMVPAISFAYENCELDIMERVPRNSKRDHLVNSKLISFAYLQIGIVQAAAGFFTYFYMMNDYGLRPSTLFGLALEKGYLPNDGDVYNAQAASSKGNTNFGDESKYQLLDWISTRHNAIDIRLFYTSRAPDSWSSCRWSAESNVPEFYYTSHMSGGQQICYTTEALFYAQTGYLISIVCVQWSDLLICKTRNLSISQQGMVNGNANFALFFETALVAILSYVPFLNMVLGTRQIAFPHFAVPSFSFFTVICAYDELRKVFLRRGMKYSKTTGRVKFDGWVIRNTYY